MDPSARLYHCARCHRQVILCRRCDRGQVYCAAECARQARRDSLRRAGASYRETWPGRLNNALRQRRFRARQQKVTHQGSVPLATPAVLDTPRQLPDRVWSRSQAGPAETLNCHRCGCICSPFLRRDFLRSRLRTVYPP